MGTYTTLRLCLEDIASRLAPQAERGARRINDDAVEHVAASIQRLGWRQPVVARPSGEVIAGNTRLMAARELDHERVPVVWFEGPDLEATAYSTADNRPHEFFRWDDEALADLLEGLRAEDALDGVGFSDADIDELLAGFQDALEPGEIDDHGPEARRIRGQRGSLVPRCSRTTGNTRVGISIP